MDKLFEEHSILFPSLIITLVFWLFLIIGFYTSVFPRMFNPEGPVPYRNPLVGQNLIDLEKGTHTYNLNITNPFEMDILIYSFFFTEPAEISENITFSCDISNGTKILPAQKISLQFNLLVEENIEGEVYLRVGCLKEGIDFVPR